MNLLTLGYGYGIPAIMAGRSLSSRKERLIVTILVCLAVPCISQTGAFIVGGLVVRLGALFI